MTAAGMISPADVPAPAEAAATAPEQPTELESIDLDEIDLSSIPPSDVSSVTQTEAEITADANARAQQSTVNAQVFSQAAQDVTADLQSTMEAVQQLQAPSFLSLQQDQDDDSDDGGLLSPAAPLSNTASSLPSDSVAPVELVVDATVSFLEVMFAWVRGT